MMDSLGSPKRWVHKTLQQVIPPLPKTILTCMDSLFKNIKSYHGRDMMDSASEFEKLKLSRAKT